MKKKITPFRRMFPRIRTHFEAGGLREPPPFISAVSIPEFVAPKASISRHYCLPANDQGQTSSCVGQTVAGFCEVQDWCQTHKPKQIDGFEVYKMAKEQVDRNRSDGTSLEAGFQAAQNLKLPGADGYTALAIRTEQAAKFAMHEHRVMIGACRITEGWNHSSITTGAIDETENNYYGNHAILFCDYDEEEDYWAWINSWGPQWGKDGYGRMSSKAFKVQFMYGLLVQAVQ